jgi:hypothetical protein
MNRIDTYKRDIRKDFKWGRILSVARDEGEVWLGTIFALTPSGKFYMPWACSNVMGCKRCRGTGGVMNRKADPIKYAVADRKNAELLADLLANHGPWAGKGWPSDKQEELEGYRKVANDNAPMLTCTWCNGHGSHEAAKDADWWDALTAVAASLDLMVGRYDGESEDGVWICDPNSPVHNNENEEAI